MTFVKGQQFQRAFPQSILIPAEEKTADKYQFLANQPTEKGQCNIFFILLYEILTKMLNFFHIPVKVISRQVHNRSLIPTPFEIKIELQRETYLIPNQLVPLANHFDWSTLKSESLLYKGLPIYQKQFSIDYFLCFFGSFSPTYGTVLATITPSNNF